MSNDALRIARPRVLTVRRIERDRISVGDLAVVQFGPGLLQFLNLRDSAGRCLGEGFAPEWIVPLSAASTAATIVSREPQGWTGASLSVDWVRAARSDETVLANAQLQSFNSGRFGNSSMTSSYKALSKESGDVLAHGIMIFVIVAPEQLARRAAEAQGIDNQTGGSVVTTTEQSDQAMGVELLGDSPQLMYEEPPEAQQRDLFYLERPRLLKETSAREGCRTSGDVWEVGFPAGLFRLLINPIAGGVEPVGRRFHPFGFVSLGASLHAAAEIFGPEMQPAKAQVRWLRAVTGRSDFRLLCKLQRMTDSSVTLRNSFFEAGAEVAHIWLTLSRTVH